MVQMPPLNSKVFYFPQGHAEHAHGGKVDFTFTTTIPPFIPCCLSGIKYMADSDTDEVFVKLSLTPLSLTQQNTCTNALLLDLEDGDDCGIKNNNNNGGVDQEKPASFAKTLTQSDANNGGGFSVPRYCAETIFPRLDYSADPPVQNIIAKDVHGNSWKFRHIYRGTPRRHLLTTGWSNFVSQKKLVAGDSIVFLRAKDGDLCVGIRRAKKVPIGGGGGSGEVPVSSVIEAVSCGVNGRPFEVVYYPRGSTPEFCVKASVVRDSMKVRWCSGMRFKMPFETEDSSRISWFMGTISSVQILDPIHWPNSPWRLLQVVWDEPELLQHVKCVNPWLVELVSDIPTYHLSPFSPARKRPRFIHNQDFHLISNQLPIMPGFPSNYDYNYNNDNHLVMDHSSKSLLMNIQESNSSISGIQGVRHAQFLDLSPSDFPFFNKLPSQSQHMHLISPSYCETNKKNNADISCLLSVGNTGHNLKEEHNNEEVKSSTPPHIFLFGQMIHTEQHCSSSNGNSSSDEGTLQKTQSNNASELHGNSSPVENPSSNGGSPWYKDQHKSGLGTENVNLLCLAL
ncbi:hypothetical protein PIB30_019872 [Stylosanthes scabra]|uniref:Auxin response factor n=1 Tax=Stylosanthes scabra TaxID=79078 RepID=A0ABU6S874_9FABA|nr:hypothetical protein [Stylosanthes scabra]